MRFRKAVSCWRSSYRVVCWWAASTAGHGPYNLGTTVSALYLTLCTSSIWPEYPQDGWEPHRSWNLTPGSSTTLRSGMITCPSRIYAEMDKYRYRCRYGHRYLIQYGEETVRLEALGSLLSAIWPPLRGVEGSFQGVWS